MSLDSPPARERSPAKPASRAAILLRGRGARDGFVFHDGYDQPIHQCAPGLLGLLEGRLVVERWKPAIVKWMDEAGHFFKHIEHEFDGEPHFDPIRREIDAIRELDAPPAAKNRFLFQYFTALAGELERNDLAVTRGVAAPLKVGRSERDVSLGGEWNAYYRQGPGIYAERSVVLPASWELIPGIANYAGSMRFTKAVRVPKSFEGRRIYLSFAGVDYFADAWLNGHHVGGHEGFFGPFSLDVSPFVRYGDLNIVRLAVTSPNEPAGTGIHVTSGWDDFRPESSFPNRKTLIKGTLGHHDAKRGGAWSSVTSQDANTGGPWNDISLRVRNSVHLAPSEPKLTTRALDPGLIDDEFTASVDLNVSVRNVSADPVPARVRARVRPANFDGVSFDLETAATLQPGTNEVTLRDENLSPVKAWQPWDQGRPHLYTVTVSVDVRARCQDEFAFETGFRKLSITSIGESTGANGALVINGKSVFVRGTNLLPTYWLSGYGPDRIDSDFQMLRDAGFNAIMIHALVGPKRLYQAANRHGLMVVQMFPLQWSYEQSLDFVERATHQVRELTGLLYNEPSVVSYETQNEPDMRTADGLDNRMVDFQLHAVFRQADPHRWATTFSGGNHAYPGQFYPLRDDNGFETLPARFEHGEFAGRRISRHRNMPTEFGIQAMPNPELFREILDEERIHRVLERIRTDPKWIAAGGESWQDAQKALAEAKDLLGLGNWDATLEALDWRLLRRMGQLVDEVHQIEQGRLGASPDADMEAELVSRKLAVLVLEVLHYGAFKGENFWFGLWRPGAGLDEFVAASQDRQYRLHKDAIENYMNAAMTGDITGYFSFMFRDPDRHAPTWGVVDAAFVPKKAYRAYVESNQPARVSLPLALRRPVKLPGDPWVEGEVVVSNDTSRQLRGARVSMWVEDSASQKIDGHEETFTVELEPGSGARVQSSPSPGWVVARGLAAGTYYLKARLCTDEGDALSTNCYEFVVPDTTFAELGTLSAGDISQLLDGRPGTDGFHYWSHGHVVYRAEPGIRGLLAGYRHARDDAGIDLYETTQGEHFFHHVLAELEPIDGAQMLTTPIWCIRSETVSPRQKTDVLMRYLEHFAHRAHEYLTDTKKGRPQ